MKERGALLPAGTAAYVFEEAARRRAAEERIVERLRAAGYREAIVPSADYLAPYAPHLGAREERELYRFVDRHGDAMALRADFTIAIARHLAPRLPADGETTRLFYRGEVLRGGGRDGGTAEFYQVGAELLGGGGAEAELEIVERCIDSLEVAQAGQLWIVLSLVGGLQAGLTRLLGEASARSLGLAVRERRLQGIAETACELTSEQEGRLRRLLEGGIPPDDPILAFLGTAGESLGATARALSRRKGCDVTIDLAEAPSRSYYTGFFFSVFGQEGGEPIAGGGRYDDLYAAFGKARPAVGFSLGLEMLVRS